MDDNPISYHPVYRAYIVGPGGGILLAHEIRCETDEQAIQKAREFAEGNAVELWDRGRKIIFIPPFGKVD